MKTLSYFIFLEIINYSYLMLLYHVHTLKKTTPPRGDLFCNVHRRPNFIVSPLPFFSDLFPDHECYPSTFKPFLNSLVYRRPKKVLRRRPVSNPDYTRLFVVAVACLLVVVCCFYYCCCFCSCSAVVPTA